MSAPAATASAVAAAVAHSRSTAGALRSHEPASTAPRKSLRDRATKRGRPRARSSPSPARIRRSSSTERSKSSPGSSAICSSATPRPIAASIRSENQRDEVADGIRVARGLAIDPRRSLDVHEDVAASALGDQAPHLGVAPPEMSLIAAAPASSARRATSGWKVSTLTGTPAPATSPSTAGIEPRRLLVAPTPAGRCAAGTAPTSSRSKPADAERQAVARPRPRAWRCARPRRTSRRSR